MRTKLKGGSLSGTYMMDGYVRKECSTIENREYGYNRWYSQLKRLQRYNHLFPELFPRVLGYGVDGNMAYYDMDVVAGVNGYEFLKNETSEPAIEAFFNELIRAMNKMHDACWLSAPTSINLYIEEEIKRKLLDYGTGLAPFIDLCVELSLEYEEQIECFTHGNLTLENVMYDPKNKKIVFIDPYEENIIDSRLCDYSQILQSCHSHYEWLNDPNIGPVPSGIEHFGFLFHEYLHSNLSQNRIRVVSLFEITQFIRMLPFKKQAKHYAQADFFYDHAQKLFKKHQIKWSGK